MKNILIIVLCIISTACSTSPYPEYVAYQSVYTCFEGKVYERKSPMYSIMVGYYSEEERPIKCGN